jgi:hypothetical protein
LEHPIVPTCQVIATEIEIQREIQEKE